MSEDDDEVANLAQLLAVGVEHRRPAKSGDEGTRHRHVRRLSPTAGGVTGIRRARWVACRR